MNVSPLPLKEMENIMPHLILPSRFSHQVQQTSSETANSSCGYTRVEASWNTGLSVGRNDVSKFIDAMLPNSSYTARSTKMTPYSLRIYPALPVKSANFSTIFRENFLALLKVNKTLCCEVNAVLFSQFLQQFRFCRNGNAIIDLRKRKSNVYASQHDELIWPICLI